MKRSKPSGSPASTPAKNAASDVADVPSSGDSNDDARKPRSARIVTWDEMVALLRADSRHGSGSEERGGSPQTGSETRSPSSPSSQPRDGKTNSPTKSKGRSNSNKTREDDSQDPPIPLIPLPLLALGREVIFPQMMAPLVIDRRAGIQLIDRIYPSEPRVALATQRNPEEENPGTEGFHPFVCLGTILKMLKFPDGSTRVVCQGEFRGRLIKVFDSNGLPHALVEPLLSHAEPGVELDAVVHAVNQLFSQIVEKSPLISEEFQVNILNANDPSVLADLLAANLNLSVEDRIELLGTTDVVDRLKKLVGHLTRQLDVLELSSKLHAQVGSEMNRVQREHFLRQQIRIIQEELGESDKENTEVEELWNKLEKAKPPKEVLVECKRDLDRLANMHPSSAEHSIVRTHLDWIASLPWSKSTRDRLNLKVARKILDADHYNLEKVKQRILEYLAVRKLCKSLKGPILCLVGPPGTGKTSLGKSIARTLGREFVRISLGGVHDEAEIRGHRRTYVAAMPGRIIQGLRKCGTNNPVMMLDEVDKLGHDFRGDPAAALLEVLDPEQNKTFRDHYLDHDFDLSKILFLATANALETIPHALRDRMEVLELPGYSEEEKLLIAHRYLIPKQLAEHGLAPRDVKFPDDTVRKVIVDYTREAGLRNLERELAAICRKVAVKHAEGDTRNLTITPANVTEWLGPPKFFREAADQKPTPGLSTGLAWTPSGGEILFIEATANPGKGSLTLTGLLGDSMRESAQAAMSYLKSHAASLAIDPKRFDKADVHIHVPAGAVPKDGPSAGVAIVAALVSLWREMPIRPGLAMTGEVTLTGRVLPVGGVREKVLAARRSGVREIILPVRNEKDLTELPPEVRQDLVIHLVAHLDEVLPRLFESDRATQHDNHAASSERARLERSTRSRGRVTPHPLPTAAPVRSR